LEKARRRAHCICDFLQCARGLAAQGERNPARGGGSGGSW
jgi:hypothetical protein